LEWLAVSGRKNDLRAAVLARRRALPRAEHVTAARRLAAHVRTVVAAGTTVCAYVPMGTEPGTIELIDALVDEGVRVLLPVARHDAGGIPQPLQWGSYRPGTLVAAPFGLREPAPPWLPAEAIATAADILVPALAVDRTGVRLGRGAGFYDRSLPLADPSARLIAVVRDEELVDAVPSEPHDVPMTHALTPTRGLVVFTESTGMAQPT
jgi:5-formyltetrahydrofolate cyclo-ligase